MAFFQQGDVGSGEQLPHPLPGVASGEGHISDDAVVPGRADEWPVQEFTLDVTCG